MLLFCNLQDERKFYEQNWTKMTDDLERQLIIRHYPVAYSPTEIELQDLLLIQLEIFNKNGTSINTYNLPQNLSNTL